MKRNGQINPTDWKLHLCSQETGRQSLHSWGPETEARAELQQLTDNGRDVWLIAPDGRKHTHSEPS